MRRLSMRIDQTPGEDASDTAFFGHPRGLGWLSFSEFWERFSYYGMQALLVLYMTHRLLLAGHVENVAGFAIFRRMIETLYGPLSAQALASVIFGLYAGLVYVTPIAGGLLADRVLGRTPTIILGASLMAVGHFLMAFDASFLLALLCLLIGAGCFKGNLAAQVGGLYKSGDRRAADGFQVYFLAINVAVMVAPLVCGTLGEVYAYHWGFGAAGVGMLLGVIIYLRGMRWLPADPPKARGEVRVQSTVLAEGDGRRLALMLALLPVLGLALVGNFQVFNAYLLWAEDSYRLQLFGFQMPVTWLLSIGSIVVLLSIVATVWFWRWWAKTRTEPSEITKMTIGALLLTLGPLVLALGSYVAATTGQRISLLWALFYELANDIGYANLLPVGLALYSRAAPKSLAGMMVSVYYLLLFFCNMVVGWLGGLLHRMSGTQFWLMHAAVVFGAAVILMSVRSLVRERLAAPVDGAVLAAEPA